MRFIILHYHILKNAGTTIENILDRNFGERLARLDTEHRDGRIEQRDIVEYLDRHPHVEAISSHQIHYPVPAVPGYLFFDWCFLRDPVDRLRSTYDYFRQHPADGDPLSEAANQFEFAAYMRRLLDRFPEQVDNPQTNLLANGEADRETVPEDLPHALECMRQIVFLGVVDLFAESAAAGRHRLRAIFPRLDFSAQPANVSSGLGGSVSARRLRFRESVGRAIYAEVQRLNVLDFRLLRAARSEIRRRLAFVPAESPIAIAPPQPAKSSRLPWALRRDEERNRRQGLFDPAFYLDKYPDVRAAVIDPLQHYVMNGAAEGRKPHRLFDPAYYLRQRPEARTAGVDPLLDFLEAGAPQANPHPLFDCAGDAGTLVNYAAKHPTATHGPNAVFLVSDEPADLTILPQQRAFFEAIRPDQLRAQTSSGNLEASSSR